MLVFVFVLVLIRWYNPIKKISLFFHLHVRLEILVCLHDYVNTVLAKFKEKRTRQKLP